ncbi:hypothetical protein cypCar_00047346, partial [Cyprinus carpio]
MCGAPRRRWDRLESCTARRLRFLSLSLSGTETSAV